MYSVMMATMLLSGAQTPAWGHGCHGCSGCHGYPGYACSCSCYGCRCYGCYGGCYCGGCYGCSCSCYCSGCYGCSCSGCWCSGSYCSGCYCSGCSCWGYSFYSSCGGCWCSGCSGMNFCSCSGVVVAVPYCSGCSCSCAGVGGGTMQYSVTPGAAPGGREVVPMPGGRSMPPADGTTTPRTQAERDAVRKLLDKMRKDKAPQEEQTAAPANPESGAAALPARLTVRLPADARLWVDQVECPLTTGERSFNTPVLQPGQTYYYTLKMQLQRQGNPVTESKRVLVSAGQNVSVVFHEPEQVRTVQR
jgi:uncharacterized protein (TIGR03000 family)